MNKIKNYTVLFFLLLLSSCAYEPILNNKNYNFSIVVEKIDGDQKLNSKIINNHRINFFITIYLFNHY